MGTMSMPMKRLWKLIPWILSVSYSCYFACNALSTTTIHTTTTRGSSSRRISSSLSLYPQEHSSSSLQNHHNKLEKKLILKHIDSRQQESHNNMIIRIIPSRPFASSFTRLYNKHMWEGDDIRWSSRLRRRWLRRRGTRDTPIRNSILLLQVLTFVYQIITTVNSIRTRFPEYWPGHALPMIGDAIWGSTTTGPLTSDFAFSIVLSNRQPHRYLTSGFIHGGILHLLVSIDTLQRRQPSWLETGLGSGLYLTTFVLSIVAGNISHVYFMDTPLDSGFVLGSSGGISGLYGLLFISMVKMGNSRALQSILRGMATMILLGSFFESISTPSHFGGFLCGMFVGMLSGPKSYPKNYALRRKNSVQYDDAPRDYRQAMGFGIVPSTKRWIPLPLLWTGLVVTSVAVLGVDKIRAMPFVILRGFLFPGSL